MSANSPYQQSPKSLRYIYAHDVCLAAWVSVFGDGVHTLYELTRIPGGMCMHGYVIRIGVCVDWSYELVDFDE